MPNGLPESIEAEIAGKRTPSSEDQPNNGGEPKKDEQPKADEPKKDEPKKAEKPEPKKGEAAKPKNGQSIAQVAAAADEEDDSYGSAALGLSAQWANGWSGFLSSRANFSEDLYDRDEFNLGLRMEF